MTNSKSRNEKQSTNASIHNYELYYFLGLIRVVVVLLIHICFRRELDDANFNWEASPHL